MDRFRKRGFTLIELMIVISIVGLLASTAILGFKNYIKRSKLAEGPLLLKSLSEKEMEFYQRPRTNSVGADLFPCFLVAYGGAPAPTLKKKNGYQDLTNMQFLGFGMSSETYFQLAAYAANPWTCDTPDQVARNSGSDVFETTAFTYTTEMVGCPSGTPTEYIEYSRILNAGPNGAPVTLGSIADAETDTMCP